MSVKRWQVVLLFILWLITVAMAYYAGSRSATSSLQFNYYVYVKSRETNQSISNAEVRLEISGERPALATTAADGLAGFAIDSARSGEPGLLRIEAEGYRPYEQYVDLIEEAAPVTVQLEPVF